MSDSLARTGLAAAGAIGGFIIAGPAGAAAGLALGSAAGFFLFPPKGKMIEGRRLDDLTVSFSTYGVPIKILDGMMELNGNYVWSDGLKEHRKEEEVGGKGTPSVVNVTFLYTSNWRINYCEGVAQAILKNWADNAIITDITGSGPTTTLNLAFENEDAGITGTAVIRNFLGGEDQLPGPAEQAHKGVDNTSAYRGQVGQEYENYPLERHGNRIPSITGLVAMLASESLPFKRITPDVSYLTQTAWYSTDPRIIYVGNNPVNKVDLVSLTVVDKISYSAGTIAMMDHLDRVWNWRNLPSDDVDFRVYDAASGLLIASSEAPEEWLNGVIVAGMIPLRGGRNGAIAIGSWGRMIQLSISTTLGKVIHGRDHNSLVAFEVSTYFPGTYDINPDIFWAEDGSGDSWFTIKDGSDGTIIRLDSDTGTPVERAVLTGVVITRITYYEDQNSFILQNGSNIIKFSLDSLTVVDTLAMPAIASGDRNDAAWRVIDGKMYIQEFLTGNGGIYDVASTPMVRIEQFQPNDWIGGISNLEAPLYDPVNNAIIVTGTSGAEGGNYLWLFLNRMTGNEVSVKAIFDRYSDKVDLTPDVDMDASDYSGDFLPGYLTKDRGTARNALEPLATAFNARQRETNWIVEFVKRGSSPVFAITDDDLGAFAGEESEEIPLPRTWLSPAKFYEIATISFIDPEYDWQINTQSKKRNREAIQARGSLDFSFPGALGVDLAAQIIDRILWLSWASRLRFNPTVNWDFLLVDPGDVGTITKDGKTYQVEVTKVDLGANGTIRIEAIADETVAHTSTVSGSTAHGHVPQVIVLLAASDYFILDSVLFRDQDDGAGIYVAAGMPDAATFPGTQIYRSTSSEESTYSVLTGVASSRAASYGRAVSTLGDADPDLWDRINTLTISMQSGSLSSDTEDNVLNGANALLIGGEVVLFLNATLNGDGTHTIDTLLRGQLGSEWAIDTHVANEDVLVLSTTTLVRVSLDISDLGNNYFYNALTLGSSDFGAPKEQTLQLVSQKPRAPAHVTGSISANDWILTATRRTRIGGEWQNLSDFVPLGEDSESYEWDIYDGATFKRTLTSTVPSVTYTEADQVIDFGSAQTTLKFDVRQMSASVGRGFSTEVTMVGA